MNDLADTGMEATGTIGIRDSPLSEEELVEIGQNVLDSPEQGGDSMEIGHVFPESTYVNHGALLCEDTTAMNADK